MQQDKCVMLSFHSCINILTLDRKVVECHTGHCATVV